MYSSVFLSFFFSLHLQNLITARIRGRRWRGWTESWFCHSS